MFKSLIFFSQFLAIFFFLIIAQPSFGAPLSESGDRLGDIKNRGYLKLVSLKRDNPPFILKDKKGEDVGLNIILAKEMANALGVELVVIREAETFDDVVDQVAAGKGDLGIASLSVTLKRAEKVNFSDSYFSERESIIFGRKYFSLLKKNDEDSLRSFFDRGETLGVVKGSAYVDFAIHQFPKAKLAFYDSWANLVEDLDKGIVPAGFWHEFQVSKLIYSNPQGAFLYKVIFLKGSKDDLAIAVPKGDQDFLSWINLFLKARNQKITVKYLLDLDEKYNSELEV